MNSSNLENEMEANDSMFNVSSKVSQVDKIKNHEEGSDIREFFIEELQDIFWAENHLLKSLPELKEATTTWELEEAIADHILETENQVTRLHKVFELLGVEAEGQKCEAMTGLVKEAQQVVKDTKEGSIVRDVAIIIACQKVEHYEIAAYGSLRALAQIMGESEIEELLEETLEEEKTADVTLSSLATGFINEEALEE